MAWHCPPMISNKEEYSMHLIIFRRFFDMKRHKMFVICLAAMICLAGCGGNSKGDTAEAGTKKTVRI